MMFAMYSNSMYSRSRFPATTAAAATRTAPVLGSSPSAVLAPAPGANVCQSIRSAGVADGVIRLGAGPSRGHIHHANSIGVEIVGAVRI
jgi:hypothetical protein